MSTESEFIAATDRVLQAIAGALDDADADVDWALNDGVLTIECAGGSKLIVNRHLANRELWVAAKAGGFHFRPEAGNWQDTRSGESLSAALSRLLHAQAGVELSLPPLIAP
jgi:CyaY protein